MDYTPLLSVARQKSSDDPSHDFLHVERVLKNAQLIIKDVRADADVIIPDILLHELFNYPKGHPLSKFSGDVCAKQAKEVLEQFDYPYDKLDKVVDSIRFHSFSRGVVPEHIEGKIVQDADRLDAVGAIGLARLFATCSEMKTPFYDQGDPFGQKRELDDKKYGLDHVYTKLFRIAETMHTETAKEVALNRIEFMKEYIRQFRSEIY